MNKNFIDILVLSIIALATILRLYKKPTQEEKDSLIIIKNGKLSYDYKNEKVKENFANDFIKLKDISNHQ